MARPKIPRKSTTIDMTAMCDVAFLLLAFFILTTKFKPDEAVPINTPSSVASKIAPDKDLVIISINKNDKVFLSIEDNDKKAEIANLLKSMNNITVNQALFVKADFIGVPFSQLNTFLNLPKDQRKAELLPGIPVDTTKGVKNEMADWMKIIASAYQGQKLNILLKGDNLSKFGSVDGILTAFKRNDLNKFQVVTDPENIPKGTDLWNLNIKINGSGSVSGE